MLKLEDISFSYGKIKALEGINLEIKDGKITALLGANGAGKSTLVKIISGLIKPLSGTILLNNENITKSLPHERVRKGISVVPERRRLFEHLSVFENMMAGSYIKRKNIKSSFEMVCSIFPILKERRNQIVSTLSGGQQQAVALARGLMSDPDILVLDEPLLGLQPSIVLEMIQNLKKIADLGKSILLVEQNFYQVSIIMDFAYIMEHTMIVLHGEKSEIIDNPEIKKAYLGL
ncbi:MAG: ABC transporter ATP-binding protein [Actinobacteria bacterium]|nr:ABC transporter ATP-binding protein [Actinomycetota bacterium]